MITITTTPEHFTNCDTLANTLRDIATKIEWGTVGGPTQESSLEWSLKEVADPATASKHVQLVETIIDNLRSELLQKVEHFPENWDGIEIREYVVHRAKLGLSGIMDRTRKKNFTNDLLTKPL